jgi:hypothetical protein
MISSNVPTAIGDPLKKDFAFINKKRQSYFHTEYHQLLNVLPIKESNSLEKSINQ